MSKISKYFYLLAAAMGGACVFEGCWWGGFPNVFQWGWPRAIWLWLSEDLVTH